jgi:IS4 transposase
MSQYAAGACPGFPGQTGYFLVVETQKKEPDMRYQDSIFGSLLKPISRRGFGGIVARHDGDAYDKAFMSWHQLVVLIFAQLGAVRSLRGLVAAWNANAHHHYHLGSGPIARSTLSDANQRRPTAIFAETFAMLAEQANRHLRREGKAMLRLIDATPIPLGTLCRWAEWNGRTRGLKMHVVFDPRAGHPRRIVITPSTVNDVEVGRQEPIEAGATYVFDKAYCDYDWWSRLNAAGAFFVTRPKKNASFDIVKKRRIPKAQKQGDGFEILADAEVWLGTHGKTRLAFPLRRIRIKREDGAVLDVISNDLRRSAREIGALYKERWQACPREGGDRALVPLAQAASEDHQLSRAIRERHPAADPDGNDRLSPPAHRRQTEPQQPFGFALRRTRRPVPFHPQANRTPRQAARRQPQQTRSICPPGQLSLAYG